MIIVKGVTKTFGRITALKNVSFEIEKGEIVGFLGQNGAGKTTLMRILTSYLLPTNGSVSVAGKDALRDPLGVRREIGYLPETPPLYSEMTVKEYLKFAAQLKDVKSKYIRVQVDRALDECRLGQVRRQMIGTLSKGYKQRVGIAQAIVHNPEVLILDEPMNGLDPVQILHVRKLIKNLEQSRTVILSTHNLPEIEQIAKRVLIIKSGEVIADDSLVNLAQKYESRNLEEVFLKLVKSKDGNDE